MLFLFSLKNIQNEQLPGNTFDKKSIIKLRLQFPKIVGISIFQNFQIKSKFICVLLII